MTTRRHSGSAIPCSYFKESFHACRLKLGPATIGRANLNGSNVNETFIRVTKKNLFGLALDPGTS